MTSSTKPRGTRSSSRPRSTNDRAVAVGNPSAFHRSASACLISATVALSLKAVEGSMRDWSSSLAEAGSASIAKRWISQVCQAVSLSSTRPRNGRATCSWVTRFARSTVSHRWLASCLSTATKPRIACGLSKWSTICTRPFMSLAVTSRPRRVGSTSVRMTVRSDSARSPFVA